MTSDFDVEYKTQILRYVTVSWTVICFWEHIIWITSEFRIWNDLYVCTKHALYRCLNRKGSTLASPALQNGSESMGPLWRFQRRTSVATVASSGDASHRLALAGQRSPPLGKLLVLLVRYTLLVCTTLSFILYLGRPANCTGMFTALWATFAACWAFGSAIFLLRVYVIWDKSRKVLALFLLLWLAALGGWVYDVTQYTSFTVTSIPAPQPWCVPAPDTKFRAFCWGMCLLFDSAVLIATLIKLGRDHEAKALWSRGSGGSAGLVNEKRGSVAFGIRGTAVPAATGATPTDDTTCDLESALGSPLDIDPSISAITNRATITKKYLLWSNLVYFFIAFAVNLSCFVVELAVSDSILSHIPSPMAFALNPLVAVRSVLVADNYIRSQMDRAQQAQAEKLVRSGIGSTTGATLCDHASPLDLLSSFKPGSPSLPSDLLKEPQVAAATGTVCRGPPASTSRAANTGSSLSPTSSLDGFIPELGVADATVPPSSDAARS